jgi:hypothetical protein
VRSRTPSKKKKKTTLRSRIDLFTEKSGPDFFDAEKRTINFEKMRLIGRTLVLLRNMQVYNYRLQALPQIQVRVHRLFESQY